MTCPGAEALLRDFYGESAEAVQGQTVRHALGCPSCRPVLLEHEELAALLDALPRAPLGDSRSCLATSALAAWLDGTLPPAEQPGVVDHLSRCADCLEEVLSWQARLARASASAPAIEAEPEVARAAPAARTVRRGVWAALAASSIASLAWVLWPGRIEDAVPVTNDDPGSVRRPATGSRDALPPRRPVGARPGGLATGILSVRGELRRQVMDHARRPGAQTHAALVGGLQQALAASDYPPVRRVEITREAVARLEQASEAVDLEFTIGPDGSLILGSSS